MVDVGSPDCMLSLPVPVGVARKCYLCWKACGKSKQIQKHAPDTSPSSSS